MSEDNLKPDAAAESTGLVAIFSVQHPLTGDPTPIVKQVDERTTVGSLMSWHRRHCANPNGWNKGWFDVRIVPMTQ